MFKKAVSLLLAASMMFSVCAFAAEEEKSTEVTFICEKDFNSDIVGSIPSFGTCVAKGNKMYVSSLDGTDDKVLTFEAMVTGDMHYDFPVTDLGDTTIFEFDIRYSQIGTGNLWISAMDANNADIHLLTFDTAGSMKTIGGSTIQKGSRCKTFRVCICYDKNTHLADVYVDHKLRASGVSFSANLDSISKMRFHLKGIGEGVKPIIKFDNIRIYSAEKPIFKYEFEGIDVKRAQGDVEKSLFGTAPDEDVLRYMTNTVCLYVSQNTVAVDGAVSLIDPSNPDVKTFVQDGRAFVPVRTVSDSFGYNVEWDEAKGVVDVSDGYKNVKFTVGEYTYTADGTEYELDVPAQIVNNHLFVPVRAMCESLGKKLTYDKSGLIVIADKENYFNYINDTGVYRTLCGNMVYRTPTTQYMIETLKQNYPNNTHPRLIFNQERLDGIIAATLTDPHMISWRTDVLKEADSYLDKEPVEYVIPDGIRLTGSVRSFKARIEALALSYHMTKDERYLTKAKEEMHNACTVWTDWRPYHFLDCGEAMAAAAIGYDWLYNYLTQDERDEYRNAIVNRGLVQIMEDFNGQTYYNGKRTQPWAQAPQADNWMVVCDSGAIIAALAIADEEYDISEQVLTAAMEHIKDSLLMYGPDGAWFEGSTYWNFATSYFVPFVSTLNTIYGDTFGYIDTPGMRQTCAYIMHMTSSQGMFNVGDASAARVNSPEMFFFADYHNMPEIAAYRLENMKLHDIKGSVRDIVFYNYNVIGEQDNMPRDAYFRDTEIITMRSDWNETSSIYAAIHAGEVLTYHGQADLGTFIIDAFDYRYGIDLGVDTYDDPQRHQQYRFRAEGQNTLVINPDESAGQDFDASAVFERFESNNNGAFTIVDLTSAYVKDADSVKRGMMLTNNRSNIIIQDELHLKAPSDVWWFMQTQGNIIISEDGKSAIVEGKYKNMHVYLLQETEGKFLSMKAEHLPYSQPSVNQQSNEHYRKLAFHAEEVKDIVIPIAFSFEPKIDIEYELYSPDVVPLDKWELGEETEYSLPELTSLKVNGSDISEFDPDTVSYQHRLKDDEALPVIEAESDDMVKVTMPDEAPGYAVIEVQSKNNENFKNIYTIRLTRLNYACRPEGTSTIGIKSVEATKVPQPENGPLNTLDMDMTTRWSAQDDADIVYELEEAATLSHIGLAVYQDGNDGRKQAFNVAVSEDGVNYTQVYSGYSSGTTLDMEVFAVQAATAKYVKIECRGTSVGNWNSIVEFAAFGN